MTIDRYARQVRLPQIGEQGQERLAGASALVVGVGAVGATAAEILARAGLGRLVLVDRDIVDLSNLQRQGLFEESDAREERPKARAAAVRLAAVNPAVALEAHVDDFAWDTAHELAQGCDVLVDGTDNFATRYLLNDLARSTGRPWVYGACVGTTAAGASFHPDGPCLRCLFPDPPDPGLLPTCETAGILASAAWAAGSLSAAAALRCLTAPQATTHLHNLDVWTAEMERIEVVRDPDCPCCGAGAFPFLDGRDRSRATVLCGRNAVQVAGRGRLSLEPLAERSGLGPDPDCLRIPDGDLLVTLFATGRALVRGTENPERALAAYSRIVGD